MLGLTEVDPLPTKVDHTNVDTGKVHYMTREYRGGWGFECTYSGCPYNIANGTKYFFR
jgi:hypothetical protein